MNNNKKIAFNSVIIYLRLCIVCIIGIYTSRLVLEALGASDYGLYNVVGGVVVILNIINSAMCSSTYRYIAYEIGRGDTGNPNKIFSTSFIIHIGFAIGIVLIGYPIGEWYVNNYLNVPFDKIADAKFVFRISLITTALSTVFVPYQGLLVAYEKFTINALIDIISQSIKLLCIFYLLTGTANKLRIYALIMLGIHMLSSFLYYLYCRRTAFSTIRLHLYRDFNLTKEMISFASWTLIGAIANIGKNQGCAVLINWFFGTIINAAYAVALQVDNFIQMFARSLNNAAIPQITKSFGAGDQDRSITITAYISKYTYFLMLLVAFPVLMEINFLLNLWLKNVPNGSDLFCQLMILGALFSCIGEGIPAMINATGKIRVYQLVVNVFLLLGLPLTWACYKIGFNYYTVSIIYCIIYFFIGFLKIYMLHRVINFDVKVFFRVSYLHIMYVTMPLAILYFVRHVYITKSINPIFDLVCSELSVILVIILFGLSKKERILIKSFLSTNKGSINVKIH